MKPNERFGKLADEQTIEKVAAALERQGITVFVVQTDKEAKEKVLSLVPEGAEVMTMSSVTLETTGIAEAINASGKYRSVRKQLTSMDRNTQGREIRHLGYAADWVLGSVHAVTQSGELLVASNTGSQLGAYAYGAPQMIWVVGAQKIVKDIPEGIQRIYEYCLPLENERARKAYGIESGVNKILIINKERTPNRCTVILVKEKLGF